MSPPWMIYGAYGYTGDLLAREAAGRGHRPLLAGRRAQPLEALGRELDLETRVLDLEDEGALRAGLEDIELVAHCAGPFAHTAAPMRAACLATGTHYLDVTGEISVLVATHDADADAREAGVVLMSGTGFDVVPTDCLALHLAQALPGASRLELAFYGTGGASPGTTKTILESLGAPGAARRGGEIVPVPVAWRTRQVPFSSGTRHCVSIPWGDVATAFYTTGIPDIVVYTAMKPSHVRWMRWSAPLQRLARLPGVRGLLERWVEARVHGPDAEARATARSYLWGRVEDGAGGAAEATLEGPEGYTLTALATLEIAERVLAGQLAPGAHTPAGAFGADLVLALPGVERQG